ncbi:MAG: FadR family transcriptional regulator [Lachnospiraceae bacterium]|jgi:GntR family transcriptional repressor for pyruvate dehydrogenase complex|nr:FadR family transcriptional regulator [Lachnospiraceae bacterium]
MPNPINPLQDLLNIRPQKNMSDIIYEKISQLIQSGSLPEGYIFPNETILCEQLSIGRSTIREAYKALEFSGYVTRTKRGTVVNSYSIILQSTPLKSVIHGASHEDFLEFRLMLEGQTAALAAERALPEEVDQLQQLQDKLVTARQNTSYDEIAALDRSFHESIANYTHNPLMITSMAAIAEACENETRESFSRLSVLSETLDQMLYLHQAIIDAIRNQSPGEAMTDMLNHIAAIRQ